MFCRGARPCAQRMIQDSFIHDRYYYQMFGDLEAVKENSTAILGQWNPVPHRGLKATSRFSVDDAASCILRLFYRESPTPFEPRSLKTTAKAERNQQIRARYSTGETVSTLAKAYHISRQRVHQIVHRRRK